MENDRDPARAWTTARHGPRPSTILAVGALLSALAPILLLLGREQPAWACWLGSLLLIGGGLALSGLRPWLSFYALVPAALYLGQGLGLALAMAADLAAGALAHQWLALPKLLALAMLGFFTARQIERRRRRWLAAAAALGALKSLLRDLGSLPDQAAAALDPALGLLLAWALLLTAGGLRAQETAWAVRLRRQTQAALDDFNPPPLPPVG